MNEFRTIHRLVVKVGSSVLTNTTGRLLPERLGHLADQLAGCVAEGRQPLLVTSGAIACGMGKLGLSRRPTALAQLQACAAIGQGELMRLYAEAFGRHGVLAAQVLVTQEDLGNQRRFRNAKQTLLTLLHRRAVPIINENDTVSVEEITFGDNDRLAALVAAAVNAQLLVLLSDVDGFLQNGKPLERVEAITRGHRASVQAGARQTTKGGIASKLEAARIAGHSGIPMVLANGTRAGVVTDLLAGEPVGTLFMPARTRLTAKKWWLAFALREPRGSVTVDAGAARALIEEGHSLLASGIVGVRGRFEAGAFVTVEDAAGTELARGVCNFSSSELARIKGMKSADAARLLGEPRGREVIHRDRLVLAKELRHGE